MTPRPIGPGPQCPREHGISAALELVVYATAFMLLVGVLLYAGRLALANVAVSSAAAEAARAASITRTAAAATSAATFTAYDALDGESLRCAQRTVAVDTSGYAIPLGQAADLSVTVTCTIDNTDLVTVGIPGTITVTQSAASPLDTFRTRS